MTINDYQQEALRTATGNGHNIANAAMGLSGEAGECTDIIKKHLFHGHALDVEHLAKELGDVAWYIAVCAHIIGYDLETVLQMNVDKLRKRYPDGFSEEKSINIKDEDI